MRNPSTLRIGDAEREAAISLLGRHFADGRLTPIEHEERTTMALGARTSGDLDKLFADLPLLPAAAGKERKPAAVSRVLGGGARTVLVAALAALVLVATLRLLPLIAVVLLGLFAFRLAGGRRHGHHHVPSGGPPPWSSGGPRI